MGCENANSCDGRSPNRAKTGTRSGNAANSKSGKHTDGSTTTGRSLAKLAGSNTSTEVFKEAEAPNLESIEARIQMLREDSRMASYRIEYHTERRANIQQEIRRLKCEAKNQK